MKKLTILNETKEIASGFRKTLAYLENVERYKLYLSTFLMIIVGFLVNLPAVILGEFVDKIINLESPTFKDAIPFISIIIIAVILKELLTVIRKYLIENIATQTEKKLTVQTVSHLLKTDIGEFINKFQIGALHGRVFRSIQGVINLIKLGFMDFFPSLFIAIAAIIIAFYRNPSIAVFMILVIPIGLIIVIIQISSQKGIRISLLRGKETIDGKVVEMMGGLETIRVSNTVNLEIEKIESIAENLRKIEMKHHIQMMFYDTLKYFNEAFFYILIISISIGFAVNGIISKGDILTYSILFMSILNPLRSIHRILDESHESAIRVNDLNQLLTQPLDKSFLIDQSINIKDDQPALIIKDLSFTYPNKKQEILHNISFSINRGDKIGIVGASGCGKSTMIKIILKLIHNYSGEVHILGQDLNVISRNFIAEHISYIPQKTYIFSGSIQDNVIYGNSQTVDDIEVINALKKAQIYEETINVLGGLDGLVTENGNNLSGGQKQRIALARVILQAPEILIFDEATSALDNTNEKKIQASIEKHFANKTMIMIAHRLTTLKNTDRILVFEDGHISQDDTYTILSKVDGLFKEFLGGHK